MEHQRQEQEPSEPLPKPEQLQQRFEVEINDVPKMHSFQTYDNSTIKLKSGQYIKRLESYAWTGPQDEQYKPCPHGVDVRKGDCFICAMGYLPEGVNLAKVDSGKSHDEPIDMEDWSIFNTTRTAGGAHRISEYIRNKSVTVEELSRILHYNMTNPVSIVECDPKEKVITVWSDSIGSWIGKNRRWEKAYYNALSEQGKIIFKELGKIPDFTLLSPKMQEAILTEPKLWKSDDKAQVGHQAFAIPKTGPLWHQYENKLGHEKPQERESRLKSAKIEQERRLKEVKDSLRPYAELVASHNTNHVFNWASNSNSRKSGPDNLINELMQNEKPDFDIRMSGTTETINLTYGNTKVDFVKFSYEDAGNGKKRYPLMMPEFAAQISLEELRTLIEAELDKLKQEENSELKGSAAEAALNKLLKHGWQQLEEGESEWICEECSRPAAVKNEDAYAVCLQHGLSHLN